MYAYKNDTDRSKKGYTHTHTHTNSSSSACGRHCLTLSPTNPRPSLVISYINVKWGERSFIHYTHRSICVCVCIGWIFFFLFLPKGYKGWRRTEGVVTFWSRRWKQKTKNGKYLKQNQTGENFFYKILNAVLRGGGREKNDSDYVYTSF